MVAGSNEGGHYFWYFGPSRVCVLPVVAGSNEGGHYFWYFGPSGVRALPVVAGSNGLLGVYWNTVLGQLGINSYWSKLSVSTFLMI